MSNHLKKYNLYENTIKKMLLYAGFWPGSTKDTRDRLLTISHATAALVVTMAIFNYCQHNFNNREKLMRALSWFLGYSTILMKAAVFTTYRKRLRELHKHLSVNYRHDLEQKEYRPILLSNILWFYRPSFILAVVTWITGFMGLLRPFIYLFIQYRKGVQAYRYILPFPTLYPWRVGQHNWRYPFHYFLEAYSGLTLAIFASSTDALFGYYVFQMSGEFRILSYRVANMTSETNYQRVVRECVERHKILSKCQEHVNKIFGPIILWLLISNSVLMCFLIYHAFQVNLRKALIAILYIAMKSGQTLVYGWFGSCLTTESENFRVAVYSSDWAGSGEKHLMHDVLMMLMYKPFVLNACGIANISVDMFLNVCNTAMSYFFMLRTLDEGKAS